MTSAEIPPAAVPSLETDATELAARVTGSVLLPNNPGYAAECAAFNLLAPVQPALVVGAAGVADVQAAVQFAADRGLPVAVLTTGHQVARPADGAVLITLSRMARVTIDADAATARVEGGVQWQEVLDKALKFGLAPASGSSSTVGVIGYHLGGGQSPVLGRAYGFAADHVLAAELVTADGQSRRVTQDTDSELFWALRGGKGNFGVVTALEFRLFPVARFYGGGLFFPGEAAASVLHEWRRWAPTLPEEATTSLSFLRLPPMPELPPPLQGTFVIHLRFSSLGDAEDAERLLAPMRAVAPTVLDTIAELPYAAVAAVHMDPVTPVPWVDRSTALRDFPAEAADALLRLVGPDSGTQLTVVEIRSFGGALARPPAVPNAVAGRDVPWAVLGFGVGGPDQQARNIEQLAQVMTALAPWAHDEAMTNFLTAGEGTTPQQMRSIYGSDRYDRLVAVKRRYDPSNMFQVNHNINPA